MKKQFIFVFFLSSTAQAQSPGTYVDFVDSGPGYYKASGGYNSYWTQGRWSYSATGGYQAGKYYASGTYRGSGQYQYYSGIKGNWSYVGSGTYKNDLYSAYGRYSSSGNTSYGTSWNYIGEGWYNSATGEYSGHATFKDGRGKIKEWEFSKTSNTTNNGYAFKQNYDSQEQLLGVLGSELNSLF